MKSVAVTVFGRFRLYLKLAFAVGEKVTEKA